MRLIKSQHALFPGSECLSQKLVPILIFFLSIAIQNGVDLTPHPHSEGAFLVAQLVKNLPAMQETWVRSLGREDPLEKGKATHSSVLVWRIPWTV